MKKIEDLNLQDKHDLICYIMWSRDKIAGGVQHQQAVEALSRVLDYPINLMESISGKKINDPVSFLENISGTSDSK